MRFKADDGSAFPAWEEKKIGDVLEVRHGRDYKHLGSGNTPVMGTGGVITYVDEALCNWDCVCIGRKGTINKPIYMNVPFWSVDTLFFTKTKKNNDPLWQFYLFQTINWDRYNEATGVPSLSSTTIESIRISVPSLPEQQKIASLLSTVDETLALCRRKLDLLTQAKKALMQQIFSRKLCFKADDGSDFPEWEEKKLGDIATIVMGQSPDSKNYSEDPIGKVLVQGNADLKNGKVSPRIWTTESPKSAEPGALLMTVRAPVGALAITDIPVALGRGVCAITGPEILYYQLAQVENNHYWDRVSAGSTFTAIDSNSIRALKLCCPSESEQKKIASCLSSADALIDQARAELEQWQEVKKSLLQQLFV